jgi:LysR family transcriptional regulator for bpeEF and oprC
MFIGKSPVTGNPSSKNAENPVHCRISRPFEGGARLGPGEDWEWIEDGQVRTMPVRGRVTVNSADAYIACCLAGLGLIQIPAYDVKGHLEAGELVEVMAGYRAAPMPMTLLCPHRQHLSRRLQVFADWLEQLLIREVL